MSCSPITWNRINGCWEAYSKEEEGRDVDNLDHLPRLQLPRSSEYGTYKMIRTRIWFWLSGTKLWLFLLHSAADGPYRSTSLIRNSAPIGPYSRTMPRALWWSLAEVLFLRSEVPLYMR